MQVCASRAPPDPPAPAAEERERERARVSPPPLPSPRHARGMKPSPRQPRRLAPPLSPTLPSFPPLTPPLCAKHTHPRAPPAGGARRMHARNTHGAADRRRHGETDTSPGARRTARPPPPAPRGRRAGETARDAARLEHACALAHPPPASPGPRTAGRWRAGTHAPLRTRGPRPPRTRVRTTGPAGAGPASSRTASRHCLRHPPRAHAAPGVQSPPVRCSQAPGLGRAVSAPHARPARAGEAREPPGHHRREPRTAPG